MKGEQKADISQLIDGIYYEKLGTILATLQEWERNKANKIKEHFEARTGGLLGLMQRNGNEVNNELSQFIKVLNLQYNFMSKLKKEDKTPSVSQAFPDFHAFAALFSAARQAMLELVDFLGKFIGVTNYEFVELRKLYGEAEDLGKRLEEKKGKITHAYNHRKEQIYSKKNETKRFELQKLLQITGDLPKEQALFGQFARRIGQLHWKEAQRRAKMYQNIFDGLVHVSQLYEKVFKEDHLKPTRQHFERKTKVAQEYVQRLGEFKPEEGDGDDLFKQINAQFYKGFAGFLSEITVASWEILFRARESEVVMPTALNFKPHFLRLTFDNKLLVMGEEKEVEIEACLQDLKVSSANEEGEIEIRDKRSKDKCWVKFHTIEMEDEFILHYQAKVDAQ